jgi:hypothetical protein
MTIFRYEVLQMSSPIVSVTEQQQSGDPELQALSAISSLLSELPGDSQARILSWITSRFSGHGVVRGPLKPGDGARAAPESTREFPDIATLFVAASPTTGSEKALVVSYWLQACMGQEEWEGFAVNTELKHLGHGLKNVTDALNSLIEHKPQLVVQLRKSGKTKQARKRYKLTVEGIRKVRMMASAGSEI